MKTINKIIGIGLMALTSLNSCWYNHSLDINSNHIRYKVWGKLNNDIDIKEKKNDGTLIYYDLIESMAPLSDIKPTFSGLRDVQINSEFYNDSDTLVFNEATKRAEFLYNQFYFVKDSIRKANGLNAFKNN